jgi:hypothetical protein
MTGRALRWRDDTGSMPLALLITVVAVSLSALLTPMVLSQFSATRVDVRRVHALHAAQAGLDTMMTRLRAAADPATNKGVLDRLPCSPLEGPVGAGGSARYKVWIDYFTSDPRGHWNTSTAWPPGGPTEDPWIQLNRLSCAGKLLQTPSYALLRSMGSDTATGDIAAVAGRWLHGTYRFKTTNENINGGLIHAYKESQSSDLCMDAGSGSPAAGTTLVMRFCTPGASRQIFAYNSNLTITLVATRSASNLGMCLDAGLNPALQTPVRLQPCGTNTLPQQQWSTNDSQNLEGSDADGDLNNKCLNVKNPNIDGSLVVIGACGGPYNNAHTFSLEPTVGAGQASAATGQVVNFSQFGRCMDVTEFKVDYGYLIVWPCKQSPNLSQLKWNQKFTLPVIAAGAVSGEGSIVTMEEKNNRITAHCLDSPGVVALYPTMKPCPNPLTPSYKWKRYGNTGIYATSYTLVDFNGNCLTPTDPTVTNPDFYPKGLNISKLTLAKCDGSTLQKWNAPANLLQPLPLKDIGER